jgi:hypothetical protein
MTWQRSVLCLVFAATMYSAKGWGLEVGQVNTFENGTVESWNNGVGNPSATLMNVSTGGPAGVNDNYLKLTSTGTGGVGSRLVTLNRDPPWTGSYATAGVTKIEMDFLHLSSPGNGTLSMRVALLDAGLNGYGSQTAFSLTHNNTWQHAVFSLADLVVIGSPPPLASFTVEELRIFHATTSGNVGQSFPIAAQIGIDNIKAMGATVVPGDFNGDGDVDGNDFADWLSNFPMSSGAMLQDGDADEDGDVDGADFVVWQTHFPTLPGSEAIAVPEPTSFGVALAAGTCLSCIGYRIRRTQK